MIITKGDYIRFTVLTPALAYMLYSLEKFHRKNFVKQPENLVITSINDSQHSLNSRHYKNEAIDIRSKNFSNREEKRLFRVELELVLGKQFRVLLEDEGKPNEHFHIQVKKGTVYIP